MDARSRPQRRIGARTARTAIDGREHA